MVQWLSGLEYIHPAAWLSPPSMSRTFSVRSNCGSAPHWECQYSASVWQACTLHSPPGSSGDRVPPVHLHRGARVLLNINANYWGLGKPGAHPLRSRYSEHGCGGHGVGGGSWLQGSGSRFKGLPGDSVTRTVAFRVTGHSCASHIQENCCWDWCPGLQPSLCSACQRTEVSLWLLCPLT